MTIRTAAPIYGARYLVQGTKEELTYHGVDVDGFYKLVSSYGTIKFLSEEELYYLITRGELTPMTTEKTPLAADAIIEKASADNILQFARNTIVDRGTTYDSTGQGQERSMRKVVAMFNALTGHTITEAQGWKFMACLKLARSEQGQHKLDNYLDGAAYMALAGECADEENARA